MKIKDRIEKVRHKLNQSNFASKLLKNAMISFVGEGGAAVVTFIATILVIRMIGNRNYGILAVAYSFVLIVDTLVNFQSWHAMITFGTVAKENNDRAGLERLIKIGSIIDFSTAILGTIVAITTASFVGGLLGWNQETIQTIYILAFMITFNFTGTSIGIIRLFDHFKIYSTFRIVTEIIRLLLIILFCGIFKMGLTGAAIAYAVGYILGYLFLFIMFLNELRKSEFVSIRGVFKSDIKQDWSKIFKFTFWTSMSSSADIPVQQFDIIFLSMLSYDIVAVFKVYKQIAQVLTKVTTPIKQAVMPLFSELIAQKKYKECHSYLKKMINKGNMIAIPFVILLTLGSVIFMKLTLDPIFVEYWYFLFFYLLLRGVALSYAPIHPLFIALGQVKYNFVLALIANAIYILVVWISISSLGIWAILLGLLFEYFIVIFVKQKIVNDILLRGR